MGWPVEGNESQTEVEEEKGIERDGFHLLLSKAEQASLLATTFDMIKNHSGTGRHSYNIKALYFYNIKDNANGARTPKGDSGPQSWENHSGLVEDVGGIGLGNGQKRPAWTAFEEEAE